MVTMPVAFVPSTWMLVTFISKEMWQKLFYSKYKEITDLIHKNKQYIIIHSDGYISDMIQTFIDIGFDAVQSLEPNAGVDIFNLFKKFQNQFCFIGNLDLSLLSFGTPQQVSKRLITMNSPLVRVSGGEPTIFKKFLIDLLTLIPKHITFILETNGILLNNE